MPARPAPSTSTDAPFGSPLSLSGPSYLDSDAKPRLVMAWYIAALPATEPTSDSRSRRLGIVSLSFGMAGLVPRDARLGAFALQQIRTGFRVRQRYLSRYQAANLLIDGRQPARSMSSRRALWSASEVATRFPASMPQSKTEAARPPFLFATRYRPLPQPPRRV